MSPSDCCAVLVLIASASGFFSLGFSYVRALSLLASDTSRSPYFAFHLQSVAPLIPYLRYTSAVLSPAPVSFRERTLPHTEGNSGEQVTQRALRMETPNASPSLSTCRENPQRLAKMVETSSIRQECIPLCT